MMDLYSVFHSFSRNEYIYLKSIILRLKKETWNKSDLEFIDAKFDKFIKKTKLNKIDILRKGEVMLGEYCEVDMSNIQDIRDLIYKCLVNIDEISSPICVAIISALNTLALAEANGTKVDFNKERNDENEVS